MNDLETRIKDLDDKISFLAKEQELMKRLMDYDGEDKVVTAEEVYKDALEKSKDLSVIKTGIRGLDDILTGFYPGQLVIASGSTGSGKTQFLEFLTYLVGKDNRCLWFNFELGDLEFFEKMPEGFNKFYMPKKNVPNKMAWLENKIIEGVAKFDTNIVFIDHMHFVIDFDNQTKMNNPSIYIGTILRKLKQIALQRNLVIFLVSHMKKVDSGKEPDISDMRDSSFVGQEADTVLMVLRDEKKENGLTHMTNEVVILVRKNRRTGKVGHARLWFNENNKQYYDNGIDASRETPIQAGNGAGAFGSTEEHFDFDKVF